MIDLQPTPQKTTPRLILRAFNLADAEAFHRILCEEGILRYFPSSEPPPLERVEKFISRQGEHWSQHGYGLWALESRATGDLVGRSGLQYLPETGETEVDFILGRAYWNQGLASEAGKTALDFGFDELALEEIIGLVHPENLASRRVLEKIGMRFVEEAEYFGMGVRKYKINSIEFRTRY